MILFLDITKMDSDLARRVLIIYAREIKRLSVVKRGQGSLLIMKFLSKLSLQLFLAEVVTSARNKIFAWYQKQLIDITPLLYISNNYIIFYMGLIIPIKSRLFNLMEHKIIISLDRNECRSEDAFLPTSDLTARGICRLLKKFEVIANTELFQNH